MPFLRLTPDEGIAFLVDLACLDVCLERPALVTLVIRLLTVVAHDLAWLGLRLRLRLTLAVLPLALAFQGTDLHRVVAKVERPSPAGAGEGQDLFSNPLEGIEPRRVQLQMILHLLVLHAAHQH